MQVIPLRSAWVMSVAFAPSGNFVGKSTFYISRILFSLILFLPRHPLILYFCIRIIVSLYFIIYTYIL